MVGFTTDIRFTRGDEKAILLQQESENQPIQRAMVQAKRPLVVSGTLLLLPLSGPCIFRLEE